MSSNDEISRRRFLDRTTRTGLTLSTLGSWPVFVEAQAQRAGETKPYRSIDQSLCVGCRLCVPLCPMGAISMAHKKASIDPDECAECGTCYRARICPVNAIVPGELEWPRVLRETFSNPLAKHESTGVAGRGTEGIKTNDSQNRYTRGSMGVFVEPGRPVLGARLSDVDRVVRKFKAHGYEVIPENPIAALVDDASTGALQEEVLDEKVISCVIEFILPVSAADELMLMARELADEVESVFNLSVALRADEGGRSRLAELFGSDIFYLPNAKVNVGMARDIPREEA